jgi:molecular chaperone DnaK (HSP70)
MSAIGIDLGTTNTVVAMVYDDGPHVVPRGTPRLIPSVVGFDRGTPGVPVAVGEKADRMGEGFAAVRSIKRLMGRRYEQAIEDGSEDFFRSPKTGRMVEALAGDLQVEVDAGWPEPRRFWPHEISASILREAKAHAERCLKRPVTEATITVPAYFGDPHREATLDAARLAGIEVIGPLLDEPSAATLAFAGALGFGLDEPVLVVDWGGGTLDVTVQVSDGTQWQQLSIDGELTLGGDDLDLRVARMALRKAGMPDSLLADSANQHELREKARAAKETLSFADEALVAGVRLTDPDTDRVLAWKPVTITRAELERDMARILEIASETIGRCLDHRDVARDRIRKVLLVGGSSRIPAFRRVLTSMLPDARLHDDVDPSHSVALGAALFANSRPPLSRICPYGFDVIHDDESRTQLIQAGSEVPTPDYAHHGLAAFTRYAAQTIYRLTLAPFAERGGLKVPLGTQRLFGRGLPPSAQGTRVDVEIWLDEEKRVQALCHVEGHGRAIPLEALDKESRLLFSELLDANLEAGAVLEANQRADGGLVERMKQGLALSEAALQSRSHAHAETARQILQDVAEQVAHKHQWAEDRDLPADEQVRRRVAGWLGYHEIQTLPLFWDVLPHARREEAVEGIKALRVMLRTGAPAPTLDARYDALCRILEPEGPVGQAVQGHREASLLGMPERLSEALRASALEVRDAVKAEDTAAVESASIRLQGLRAEGEATWQAWRESGPLIDASPDLLVPKDTPNDGN